MLPVIIIMSILCQGHAVDYGMNFVTAFPENIAYYYPANLTLNLKITALRDNTNINVIVNGTVNKNTLNTSQEWVVLLVNEEVNRIGKSEKTIRIISDNYITVLSVSKRGDSMQSNVVHPTTNLGMQYQVPSPNYTELAVKLNTYISPNIINLPLVKMDFNFRLVIINAEEMANTVTVTQKLPNRDPTNTVISLGAFEMTQMLSSDSWFKVSSTAKVAVFLTNPCADTLSCRCNMIMHQLRPTDSLGTDFIIPPFVMASRANLFVTSENKVDLKFGSESITIEPGSFGLLPFSPGLANGNPILKTTEPASLRVILPGFIIDILPNSMFSGCYLMHSTSQTKSQALVIAETAQKDKTRMNAGTVISADWTMMLDTDFSWALVDLIAYKSYTIWHPSSKIAVYVFERSPSGVNYGGPAISINDQPDFDGCLLVPGSFELLNDTVSWQASRGLCKNKEMVLATPSHSDAQSKMANRLNEVKAEGEAWIGLRRSLVTAAWYWQNNLNFDFLNWNDGQPENGMCVSMKMEPNGNFTWSSLRCCSALKPLCFKVPLLLSAIRAVDFTYTWPATTMSSGKTIDAP